MSETAPTREAIVAQWHARAEAYDALCHRWPMFATLVDWLLFAVPLNAAHVVDLAGGTGLVSERILASRPGVRVSLVEPAAGMRQCARTRLGERVTYIDAVASDLTQVCTPVDAIVCNVSMHLLDEDAVFAAVASVLEPGGVFVFNYWWHSFEGLEAPDMRWEKVVTEEVEAVGGSMPEPPERPRPRQRSASSLAQSARASGLELRDIVHENAHATGELFVDFWEMRPDWLEHLGADRDVVIQRIRTRAGIPLELPLARVTVARP